MKRTYTISIWTGAFMETRVLTHIKVTAVDVKDALDKAQARARALNSSHAWNPALKADYLLCGGFLRLVS